MIVAVSISNLLFNLRFEAPATCGELEVFLLWTIQIF